MTDEEGKVESNEEDVEKTSLEEGEIKEDEEEEAGNITLGDEKVNDEASNASEAEPISVEQSTQGAEEGKENENRGKEMKNCKKKKTNEKEAFPNWSLRGLQEGCTVPSSVLPIVTCNKTL